MLQNLPNSMPQLVSANKYLEVCFSVCSAVCIYIYIYIMYIYLYISYIYIYRYYDLSCAIKQASDLLSPDTELLESPSLPPVLKSSFRSLQVIL